MMILMITPQGNATFNQDYFKTQIGLWLRSNQGSNGFGGLSPADDVKFGLTTPLDTYPIETHVTLNNDKYGNGYMLEALNALTAGPIHTIFGADYVVDSASVDPNYSNQIAISFDTLGRQYVNSWTTEKTMYLDFAPRPGTYVTVNLNTPGLICDPPFLTVAYPKQKATFKLFSATAGTYATLGRNKTTNDGTPNLYEFYVSVPTLVVDPLAEVVITPPNPSVINYNMTATDPFTITVPNTYRDPTLRLVVTVRSTPAGLTVYQNNVSITSRGVGYTFYAIGPIGTFTLSYTIAPPWNANSANNNYFTSPTVLHYVTFVEPLNITIGNIPDAYMANPPVTTDYGGAYSRLVNVYVERRPKRNLVIYINAPNCEVFPPQLAFSSSGPMMQQFYARGLVTGLRTFTFSLGGQSAADYEVPPQRLWRVFGPNPYCRSQSDSPSCFSLSGCQWNDDRGHCSNRTLPISIGHIPVLFDGERSVNVSLTLATAVRSSLRIQFVASSRLVFSPALLVLPAGTKTVNFTVTGFLEARDGIVKQGFYLRLSGADANIYQQVEGVATIRPRIQCEVKAPPPFYVGTESENFIVNCDGPPETEVFLTPVPSNGIFFVPVGMHVGSAVYMDPYTQDGAFYAISANGVVGTFSVALTISGVNAARYEVVPIVTIRTLPLASLNPLPNFHFTVYEGTLYDMHIDLSVVPPNPIYVLMEVIDSITGEPALDNITLSPPNLMFNGTQRNMVSANGILPGNYTILYNISGINYRNYQKPANSTIECKPVEDGNAFTYRLKLGFQPKTSCRLNVGRNSQTFKGQDEVDIASQFCSNVPALFANVSNGTTVCPEQLTEERCRAALARDGTVCVWFKDECTYLPQLQGSLRDIAYGSGYTLLLARNGSVYSIGKTTYGQLGHFNEHGLDRVILPENISSVVAGVASSFALSGSGRVYAWGANGKGQLGINRNIQQTEAVYEITFPRYENISCVSSGAMHAGAISLSGKVFMWGSNEFGQTGNEATYRDMHRYPIVVNRDYFDGDAVTSIQCGEYHTMVATETAAYTFGNNNQGQLGRAGFDEWMPAQPLLWAQSRFVDEPNYPSYIRGLGCPNNRN